MKNYTLMLKSALIAVLMITGSVASWADCKLYLDENIYIAPGSTEVVNVYLDNDEDVNSVQFDLVLPEGLSMTNAAKNDARANEDFEIYSNPNFNRVLLVDTYGDGNIGNSGAFCTVTLEAAEGFEGGVISFSNVTVALNSEAYDVTTSVSTVSSSKPATVQFSATSEVAPRVGEMAAISVSMVNDVEIGNLKCEVTLPEGLEIEKNSRGRYVATMTDRLNGFSIVSADAGENTVRFIVSSLSDRIYEGEGEIFSFNVVAKENLARESAIQIYMPEVTTFLAQAAMVEGENPLVVNVVNQTIVDAEEALLAANMDAALADMEKLEGYQAAISEAVAGNEEYVAGDTYQQIETLLGETYMMLIQQALDEANENGTEYVSPIDDEWWAQQIADIKAEIEANKAAAEAEAARQAANLAAAEADMEKVEALQAELSAVISGNEEFISEEDNRIIEEFLGEKYPMEIQAALEAVAEEGEYVSPIDEDALRAIIETIKANIEANKKAEEERMAANEAAYNADLEKIAELEGLLGNSDDVDETLAGDYADLAAKINELKEAVEQAYEDVAEEGEYESPISENDYNDLRQLLEQFNSVATKIANALINADGTDVYNLNGAKVSSSAKGIVIVNGKKIFKR